MNIQRSLAILLALALTVSGCRAGPPERAQESRGVVACTPLSDPLNACVVASTLGTVTRAALQGLIDQAHAQYEQSGRPKYLGPIEVTLPAHLQYVLDGPIVIHPGVRVRGRGPGKPRLTRSGRILNPLIWADAARSAAGALSPLDSEKVELVKGSIHYLRCKRVPDRSGAPTIPGDCSSKDFRNAMIELEAKLDKHDELLCPDTDCAGSYRYFDIASYQAVWSR